MPRENRKRGKKNKAKPLEQVHEYEYRDFDHLHPTDALPTAQPHSAPGDVASDAPFGRLDPDVKAYFRTVDEQLRDWKEERLTTDVGEDVDPNQRM